MPYWRLVLQHTRGHEGHKGSPRAPGHLAGRHLGRNHPLCVLLHAQMMLQARDGSGQTEPKAGQWGMSLPSTAIPHSISLNLSQLPESVQIQTMLTRGCWRGKGEPAHGGCTRLKGSPLEVTLAGPWVRVGSGNSWQGWILVLEPWLGWHKLSPTGLLADSSGAPGGMNLKFCPWFASQPGEGLVLCNSTAGSEVEENFCS